jgi:hypothetical protein
VAALVQACLKGGGRLGCLCGHLVDYSVLKLNHKPAFAVTSRHQQKRQQQQGTKQTLHYKCFLN